VRFDGRRVSRPLDRGDSLLDMKLYEECFPVRPWATSAWAALPNLFGLSMTTRISTFFRFRRMGFVPTMSSSHASQLISRGTNVVFRGYAQEPEAIDFIGEERLADVRQGLAQHPDVRDNVPSGSYAAVHVRRGDYTADPLISARFGVCSAEYYLDAIRGVAPERVLIVSDDPHWCERLLNTSIDKTVQVVGPGSKYRDLAILARADELVLSNSTFSWWGAKLSGAARVTCPDPWNEESSAFGHSLPAEWLRRPKHGASV
jgi:glycosyl transferase family 11